MTEIILFSYLNSSIAFSPAPHVPVIFGGATCYSLRLGLGQNISRAIHAGVRFGTYPPAVSPVLLLEVLLTPLNFGFSSVLSNIPALQERGWNGSTT